MNQIMNPTRLRLAARPHLHRAASTTALLLLPLVPAFGQTITRTTAGGTELMASVGGDGCDYGSLGAALSSALSVPDDVVLRVVGQLNGVQVNVWNSDPDISGNLTIEGGFSSCALANDPATEPGPASILQGGSGGPVVTVESSGALQSVVELRNLRLTGAAGWRGLVVDGALAEADAYDLQVKANSGGVEVLNGARLFLDERSRIWENDAGTGVGGGLRCRHVGTTVRIAGTVDLNAAAAGGGLAVEDQCALMIDDSAWISRNEATIGGGLSVSAGGTVTGGGAGDVGVAIIENEASLIGGGVHVSGVGSSVALPNTHIVDNVAGLTGGGVNVTNGGYFRTERFNFEPCATPPRCAVIAGNELVSGTDGSAIYAGNGAEVRFYQGYLEHHRGQSVPASAIYATGLDTEVIFEGIQIFGNVTPALFEAHSDARIAAAFVSAAANVADGSGSPSPSLGAIVDTAATVRIYNSALLEVEGYSAEPGTVMLLDCSITGTVAGVTAGGDNVVGLDPRFRDPVGGDLRLLDGSPAIDCCANLVYSPIDTDAELQPRGHNDPGQGNFLGPYDIGFDESYDRAIFVDGFEGGVNRWSSSSG